MRTKKCILCASREQRIAELHQEIERLQGLVDECELISRADAAVQPPPAEKVGATQGKSLQHQYAALTRWSRESGKDQAEIGQRGLLDRFRREALDHDPTVVEPELTRRAEAARQAHMRMLALKSAKVRAARKGVSR